MKQFWNLPLACTLFHLGDQWGLAPCEPGYPSQLPPQWTLWNFSFGLYHKDCRVISAAIQVYIWEQAPLEHDFSLRSLAYKGATSLAAVIGEHGRTYWVSSGTLHLQFYVHFARTWGFWAFPSGGQVTHLHWYALSKACQQYGPLSDTLFCFCICWKIIVPLPDTPLLSSSKSWIKILASYLFDMLWQVLRLDTQKLLQGVAFAIHSWSLGRFAANSSSIL